MAHNDMYVVMYKIIAYLYDCMKKGIAPNDEMWSCMALGIPESYWASVVSELADHRFIAGVNVIPYVDGGHMVSIGRAEVTMEGVAFAQENSMMAKAKAFLQDAKASIPFC